MDIVELYRFAFFCTDNTVKFVYQRSNVNGRERFSNVDSTILENIEFLTRKTRRGRVVSRALPLCTGNIIKFVS